MVWTAAAIGQSGLNVLTVRMLGCRENGSSPPAHVGIRDPIGADSPMVWDSTLANDTSDIGEDVGDCCEQDLRVRVIGCWLTFSLG